MTSVSIYPNSGAAADSVKWPSSRVGVICWELGIKKGHSHSGQK